MAVFKCKMCGGDLEVGDGIKIAECEYCGTKQTVPNADNEKKVNLFNRANRLRLASEFDKAAGIYESIIAEFPEEAEAYWGLCLCDYGIEYVDDPATARKIPTCHRASFEKLSEDENFNLAIEYADVVAQKVYRDEAREIDRIMQEILSVSKNEKPYDIFICYKETDEKGERTVDSVLAQDIYDALTSKGFKVFFSRITLEDKLGQQYEPYIFAALNSAKVMLAIGTKYEYYHAVWVKNEWSRFLKLMAKDKSKILIPCFKDIDAYDMPEQFKGLQAQDMSKLGFMQDLIRGINKIIAPEERKTVLKEVVHSGDVNITTLLKRASLFLLDGNWSSATEYCEKVLDIDPQNAQAYLYKLMSELQIKDENQLADVSTPFIANNNYKKIMLFGDNEIKSRIYDYCYQFAVKNMVSEHYVSALEVLKEIADYKDSSEKIAECEMKIALINKERKHLLKEKNKKIQQMKDEFFVSERKIQSFRRIGFIFMMIGAFTVGFLVLLAYMDSTSDQFIDLLYNIPFVICDGVVGIGASVLGGFLIMSAKKKKTANATLKNKALEQVENEYMPSQVMMDNAVEKYEDRTIAVPDNHYGISKNSTFDTHMSAAKTDNFTVSLIDCGINKIEIIKIISEFTGFGLAKSKLICDSAPSDIKTVRSIEDANALKARLESAGAKVDIQ